MPTTAAPQAPTALRWTLPGVIAVALAWSGAKLVSTWWWVWRTGEYSDTYYYFLAAQDAVAHGTLAQALPEYPTPAAWLLLAPYLLGADDHDAYRAAIMTMATVADAVFALALARCTGPLGVLGWIALTTALGGLPLLRFDMLPAVAAGLALLALVQRRGSLAAVVLAVGTGLKVWPIVLAPLLAAGRRRRRAVASFVAAGLVLVLGSVAASGWARLFSPLTHQGERGLQIEAVAALAPMWDWARGGAVRIGYSAFHAYEVSGTGVEGWLLATTAAGVVAALGCAALVVRWLLAGTPIVAVCWLALTLVGAFIITSPALSPQYLLWLAPAAAALLGVASRPGPQAPSWPVALVAWGIVVLLCLLTTVVYPIAYDALLQHRATTETALFVLTLRNLGLVGFVAASAVAAWRSSVATGARERRPTPSTA